MSGYVANILELATPEIIYRDNETEVRKGQAAPRSHPAGERVGNTAFLRDRPWAQRPRVSVAPPGRSARKPRPHTPEFARVRGSSGVPRPALALAGGGARRRPVAKVRLRKRGETGGGGGGSGGRRRSGGAGGTPWAACTARRTPCRRRWAVTCSS